jgi:hypothetical protein
MWRHPVMRTMNDDGSHAVRETPKGSLPENVRRQVEQRLGFAAELIP